MNGRSHHEQASCRHRRISLFCAVQCWKNGWDGIRISRDQLKQLLKLKRFGLTSRIKWMEEDFQELFPYQRQYYPFPSFELSRRAFDDQPVIGECIIPKRLNSDNIDPLGMHFVPTLAYANNNTECTLMDYLRLLSEEQISPH